MSRQSIPLPSPQEFTFIDVGDLDDVPPEWLADYSIWLDTLEFPEQPEPTLDYLLDPGPLGEQVLGARPY